MLELPLLKMSSEQYAAYMSIDPEYRICCGVYELTTDDVYFVIPFFITQDSATGCVTVPQCNECGKHLKAGKVPPFSMANENYGTPQRKLGMKCFNLSSTSKTMCFLVRGYNQIVELSDVPGRPNCIRGSMIHFKSESVVAQPRPKQLPRTNAEEYLLLHLLGDGRKVDIIKKTLGGDMRSPVRVDASFNMELLLALQAVNPEYKVDNVSICNLDEGVIIQEQSTEAILRRAVIDSDTITETDVTDHNIEQPMTISS